MYLQMIATFTVAHEFVSERDKVPGFALIAVVPGEPQRGHLRVRIISDTFSDGARLRVKITGRAYLTARLLLSGLLQHLAVGLGLSFNTEIAARRKIDGVGDEVISLDLADQPPDSFETQQALIGLSLLPGYGRAQILVEELIHHEILHRDEITGHQFAHPDFIAGGLSRLKFGLRGLLKLLQSRRAFAQLIEMIARLFGPNRRGVEREVLFPIALRLKEKIHALIAERAVEPGFG